MSETMSETELESRLLDHLHDRYEKTTEEKPTVDILLCQAKSDALVELTLPKNANIYASKYELYLPDKNLLQEKLKQWTQEECGSE